MDYSTKFASSTHLFSTDSYLEWDKLAAVDQCSTTSNENNHDLLIKVKNKQVTITKANAEP